MTNNNIVNDSAGLARKHRKQQRMLRETKRQRVDDDNDDDEPEQVASNDASPVQPHPTGIKLQARYDPGVPMTREQLVAWRKEARRVRNRESAAESRQRTRARIDELEGEVSALTVKYQAALARIMELEARGESSNSTGSKSPLFVPRVLSQVSPCPSETSSPCLSPVSHPRPLVDFKTHQEQVDQKYQTIMTMISRPAESI